MEDNLKIIISEFEQHKGQFVITESWEIERLIAIGDDEDDYYYITWNGRKSTWNTCVGKIIPLKGCIPDKDYNEFIRLAKLNHWDQKDVWNNKKEPELIRRTVEKTKGKDKYLTEVCWELN